MDWVNDNLLLLAGAIFVVLIFFAFLIRRGGGAVDEGPTLDQLIEQKELEREAQLREIEEAAEAVHQDMIDASEAHSAAQDKTPESTAVAPSEAKEEEHSDELIPEADACSVLRRRASIRTATSNRRCDLSMWRQMRARIS